MVKSSRLNQESQKKMSQFKNKPDLLQINLELISTIVVTSFLISLRHHRWSEERAFMEILSLESVRRKDPQYT